MCNYIILFGITTLNRKVLPLVAKLEFEHLVCKLNEKINSGEADLNSFINERPRMILPGYIRGK